MTASSTYVVEDTERDANASELTNGFANTALRSKISGASWIAPDSSTAQTEQILIPRAPLMRLHPAHAAIKGTAKEYASRLLSIFPELAEIEPNEIEKTLRRMRGKEPES
jgi:hypothetical protein